MRPTVAIAVALLSALICTPANASGSAVGPIQMVRSYTGHSGILVATKAAQQNPDGCLASSFYIYPDNSPRADFVQSMLLSANISGKTVEIVFDGCYEGYPRIVHVSVVA